MIITLRRLLLYSIALYFWQCQTEKDLSNISTNDNLFSGTKTLSIHMSKNAANLPVFEVSEVEQELFYIGLFDEKPVVENNEIINTGALVWHWHSGFESLVSIDFSDGVVDKVSYEVESLKCIPSTTLYWAAWAWEEGNIVSHSTPVTVFNLDIQNSTSLAIRKVDAVDNIDGLFLPEEEVRLNIVVENITSQTVAGVNLEIDNSQIPSLPLSIVINQLSPNELKNIDFSFELPADLSIGDSLVFEVRLTHSECVEEESYFHILKIDGRKARLERITLTKIYTQPIPWTTWDPFYTLPWSNPDPYFLIITNVTDTLYHSNQLENVHPILPNRSWPILNPSLELEFNKTYAIKIVDFDPPLIPPYNSGDDDPIGDVTFSPIDFLNSRDKVIKVKSERVELELDLDWG